MNNRECKNCGSAADPNGKFCSECGAPLDAEDARPGFNEKSPAVDAAGSGDDNRSRIAILVAGVLVVVLAAAIVLIVMDQSGSDKESVAASIAKASALGANDVAKVDGNAISIVDFNKTLKVNAAQSGGVVPDPPKYTACKANKKKTSPKLSDSSLTTQCEKDWNKAKNEIMTALTQRKWFELEANERGLSVTDAEVKARFTQLKQQSFPKEADYQKFLKQYDQTEADLLELVHASMLQEKVQGAKPKSKSKSRWQTEFTAKWRKKTKCADDFTVAAVCGQTS